VPPELELLAHPRAPSEPSDKASTETVDRRIARRLRGA
jgi:hypothetical protein